MADTSNTSFSSNINYLSELDRKYSKNLKIVKDNIQISNTIPCNVKTKITFLNITTKQDQVVEFNSTINNSSELVIFFSGLGNPVNSNGIIKQTMNDATVTSSAILTSITGVDNITFNLECTTTDTFVAMIEIDVMYGTAIKYAIKSTSDNYIKVLSALIGLDPEEISLNVDTAVNAANVATTKADRIPASINTTGDIVSTIVFDGVNTNTTMNLSDTGVVAGAYPKVTVNSKGRITSGSMLLASDIPLLDASKITTGTLTVGTSGNAETATKLATARTLTFNGHATGSGIFDGSANLTVTLSHAADSVTLGTHTTGNYVAGNTAGTGIAVTGTAGEAWSPTISLATAGTAGTYTKVTTDAYGRVTAGTNPTSVSGYGITDAYTKTEVDAKVSALVNSAPAVLDTLSELATAIGNDANFATTITNNIGTRVIKNADIVAGTYPKITYDAKGLVTGGSALSATDIPSLDWSKLTTGKPTTLSGYGITDAATSTHNHDAVYLGKNANAVSATLASNSTNYDGMSSNVTSFLSHAREMITGGGTVALDASYNFSWSARFIAIGAGGSAETSTSNYFDIVMPTIGTVITGVGGASNFTMTANSITIPSWGALYYILPLGSSNVSIAANFRLVQFTSQFSVPRNWIKLAQRNDDGSYVDVCTGVSLKPGESINTNQYCVAGSSVSGAVALASTATSATTATTANGLNAANAYTGVSFNGVSGLSNIAPSANGTASVGSSTLAARADHTHPGGGLPTTGGTMTGAITAIRETKADLAATMNIDLATGNVFTKTVSAATTFTVSNVLASGNVNSFMLEVTNGGAFAVTWWSGIKWANGVVPSLTVSGVDILGFYSHDGGITWRGVMLSKDSR